MGVPSEADMTATTTALEQRDPRAPRLRRTIHRARTAATLAQVWVEMWPTPLVTLAAAAHYGPTSPAVVGCAALTVAQWARSITNGAAAKNVTDTIAAFVRLGWRQRELVVWQQPHLIAVHVHQAHGPKAAWTGWRTEGAANIREQRVELVVRPNDSQGFPGWDERIGDWCARRYGFENVKKYPRMFEEGEQVVMTEKIHGTFVCFGLRRKPDGTVQQIVCSKGFGAKGFFFKLDDAANVNNVYVKTAHDLHIFERLRFLMIADCSEILLFGEIYGVQDLKYDYDPSTTNFRAFDLKLNGTFANLDTLEDCCRVLRVPMVPILYEGPFSKDILLEHTVGKETLSGKGRHVREGVVVKPVIERLNPKLPHGGRVCGKSINPAYLLRRGDTTELE